MRNSSNKWALQVNNKKAFQVGHRFKTSMAFTALKTLIHKLKKLRQKKDLAWGQVLKMKGLLWMTQQRSFWFSCPSTFGKTETFDQKTFSWMTDGDDSILQASPLVDIVNNIWLKSFSSWKVKKNIVKWRQEQSTPALPALNLFTLKYQVNIPGFRV